MYYTVLGTAEECLNNLRNGTGFYNIAWHLDDADLYVLAACSVAGSADCFVIPTPEDMDLLRQGLPFGCRFRCTLPIRPAACDINDIPRAVITYMQRSQNTATL